MILVNSRRIVIFEHPEVSIFVETTLMGLVSEVVIIGRGPAPPVELLRAARDLL